MNRKELAITALMTTLYVVLVQSLGPLSFMQIQVRIANALIGVVPVVGEPAVIGLTLGVLIGNINSPLGFIDLLSFIPSLFGMIIVLKTKGKMVMVGLSVYSLLLSAWVAFMLNMIFGVPYLITFLYVLGGMIISTVVLGYLVYIGLKKRMRSYESSKN